jgi:hypothetical protein
MAMFSRKVKNLDAITAIKEALAQPEPLVTLKPSRLGGLIALKQTKAQ